MPVSPLFNTKKRWYYKKKSVFSFAKLFFQPSFLVLKDLYFYNRKYFHGNLLFLNAFWAFSFTYLAQKDGHMILYALNSLEFPQFLAFFRLSISVQCCFLSPSLAYFCLRVFLNLSPLSALFFRASPLERIKLSVFLAVEHLTISWF